MRPRPHLLWLRRDLRLHDHPALVAACARGVPLAVLYAHDPEERSPEAPGAAARGWLHRSLESLSGELAARGLRLTLRRGNPEAVVPAAAAECGAAAVYWTQRDEPAARAQEDAVARRLRSAGVAAEGLPGSALLPAGSARNTSGRPFQVFTPFWRQLLLRSAAIGRPLPAPPSWPPPAPLGGEPLDALGLLPHWPWTGGLAAAWTPGEASARRALQAFLDGPLGAYDRERETLAAAGTSRLSPHLAQGEISVRQVWAAVRARAEAHPAEAASAGRFLSQLGWREFGRHLLHHFPETPARPLRPAFEGFPWAEDPGDRRWEAWRCGRTGYPVVDAAMRQLWATGWMHNRARMLTASFLVKHLRLPWTLGERWFWDTLVDADLAQNVLGWQWSAGCGADAAPYFRVFSPVLQGRRFDPAGEYVRRWVPELALLPARWIHQPWAAPAETLRAAGLRLGDGYPLPIVDHRQARQEALAAFRSLGRGSAPRPGGRPLPEPR